MRSWLGRLLALATLFSASVAATSPPIAEVEARLVTAEQTMIADPAAVMRIVEAARRHIPATTTDRVTELARVRALWLEGEALGRLNQTDAADTRTREALALIKRIDPGSQLHGRILMSRGAVELDQGKVRDAFVAYRNAHDIFRAVKDSRNRALALQNIGSIYSDAGDQKSVLRYYAQSADVYTADSGLAISAHNNIGLAYREMGDLARAEDEYRRALALAMRIRSPLLEARILNNIGSVQLARGRLSAAEASANRGLQLAQSGEAREWMPFLWGLKAQIASARGNAHGAVMLFDRAFAGTDLTKTSFYYRDFHKAAVDAYIAVGDQATAIRHLRAFKRLDDEAREIRSSTNAALSAAQFDFSNQELKISKLKAGQLERDVALARGRERTNAIVLTAALALLIVTLTGFFSVRRSRNQTQVANRQLIESNRSLDKALKAKSEFLATTSHEIRTPLNGILGMTQVLLGGRMLNDEVRERVGLIDVAGNTMKAIVDDILDMAKIESGRVEVHEAPFDFREVIAQVGQLWSAEATSKGIAVETRLDEAPAIVLGDERKLRQIVYNLTSNAVKFTEAGAVTLVVAVAMNAKCEEEVSVEVSDTGIGIPSDELDAVFEPFHQVDGGTTRRASGTGLGLAICRNLAEAMGGRVEVSSEVGRGSTFTLILPLRRGAKAMPASGRTARPTQLGDAVVCVVEANPLFQSILEACLEDACGSVTMVDSLDAVDEGIAHIVVIDTASLNGDGAAVERWKAANLEVPLLLLTSEADAVATGLLANGTAAAHLRKTLPPVGLAPALQTLLVAAAPMGERQAA